MNTSKSLTELVCFYAILSVGYVFAICSEIVNYNPKWSHSNR
ncbi:hypothetical protein [Pseudoalteromonas phenolica]|nr:hypothetical protein [Pseudoalteromonas phenolica]